MTVGVSFYNNGSAGFAFVPRDILVDSSFNQYLLYSFDNSGQNIRITKINADGTYAWSKEYAGLIALRNFQVAEISGDGSKIRLLGLNSSPMGQIAEISTSDGAVTASRNHNAAKIIGSSYSATLKCSRTTDSKCFFNWLGLFVANDHKVCKVDFTSTASLSTADPGNSNTYIFTVDALDDDNFIAGGFDSSSTPHKHIFYSANMSSTSLNWGVQVSALEDIFSTGEAQRIYSYINDASTKYVCTAQLASTSLMFVLHPSNGSLIEAKQLSYEFSFAS